MFFINTTPVLLQVPRFVSVQYIHSSSQLATKRGEKRRTQMCISFWENLHSHIRLNHYDIMTDDRQTFQLFFMVSYYPGNWWLVRRVLSPTFNLLHVIFSQLNGLPELGRLSFHEIHILISLSFRYYFLRVFDCSCWMTTQYAISRIILTHFTSDPVWQLESYFLAGLAGEISGVWEKVIF